MEFDLDLAVKQDSDNPLYYVQYAHARYLLGYQKLHRGRRGHAGYGKRRSLRSDRRG